jgi:hypothetical protein
VIWDEGRCRPGRRSRRGGPFYLVRLRHLEAGHVVLRNRGTVCRCRGRLAVSGVHLTSDSTRGIGGRRLIERRARRRRRLPRLHRSSRAQTALRRLTVVPGDAATAGATATEAEATTSAANENTRCMPYLLSEYGLPLSMHYGRQPATVSHAWADRVATCREAPACSGPACGNVT